MFRIEFNPSSNNKTQEKKKEKTFMQEVFEGLGKYFNKKLNQLGDLKGKYAENLSITEEQKSEIRNALQHNKMSTSGPSAGKLREAAMKVAAQFSQNGGSYQAQNIPNNVPEALTATEAKPKKEEIKTAQKEGIPLFITNRLRAELKGFGYSDEQIGKLKPEEAWEIFNKESAKDEKPYKPESIPRDVKVLHDMWEYAYDSLDNTVDTKRVIELMDLTGNAGSDAESIEDYITKESDKLKPEEKFFLEMSIELKKFRSSAEKIAS